MSEAKKLTNKYRLEQWTTIIQERICSGKQVEEWCAEITSQETAIITGYVK